MTQKILKTSSFDQIEIGYNLFKIAMVFFVLILFSVVAYSSSPLLGLFVVGWYIVTIQFALLIRGVMHEQN